MGISATEMTQVITFKDSGGSSDGTIEKNSITDLIDKGAEYISEITASKVYLAAQGKGLKLGSSKAGGSLTLKLATAVKPTKITFNAVKYGAGTETNITVNGTAFTELTADMAEYTVNYDGNTEITEIAISTPTKRAYIKDVTIYYGGEAATVATPVITGTTPFFGSTEITMGCETEGATIYYTTDGVTPPGIRRASRPHTP